MSNKTEPTSDSVPEANISSFALLYYVYNGPEDSWFFILHGMECVMGIVANSLLIAVFLQKKLRGTAHNVYLVNLSAARRHAYSKFNFIMSNKTDIDKPTSDSVPEANISSSALLYYVYNGPEDSWFFISHGTECVMGIVANSLLIAVFLQKKLRGTAHNVYLVNLSAAQLIMSVCIGMRLLNEFLPVTRSLISCLAVNVVRLPSAFTHVLTHLLVAVERFVAVRWPHKFQKFTTRRNVMIQIGLVWLLGAFWAILPLFSIVMDFELHGRCTAAFGSNSFPAVRMYIALTFLVIPCFFTASLYVPVIRKMWTRRQVNPAAEMPVPRLTENQQIAMHKRCRSMLIFLFTYVLYILCYLPAAIVAMIQASMTSIDHLGWIINLSRFNFLLLYAPLFLNPIVHICVNKDFISGFKNLVRTENNRVHPLN